MVVKVKSVRPSVEKPTTQKQHKKRHDPLMEFSGSAHASDVVVFSVVVFLNSAFQILDIATFL